MQKNLRARKRRRKTKLAHQGSTFEHEPAMLPDADADSPSFKLARSVDTELKRESTDASKEAMRTLKASTDSMRASNVRMRK